MKVEIGWKRLSISLFLILVSVSTYSAYHNVFGSPSGQIGSIEGGGFCQGNYTVYNNTIDKLLYAMNCNTGVNDIVGSTDAGNLVTTLIGSDMPNGGEAHFRAGLFNEVTSINFAGHGGITLSGSGAGTSGFNANPGASNNGTMLISKTSSLTMIESSSTTSSVTCNSSGCTGAPISQNDMIKDISLDGNCKGGVAIDFRMTESGGVADFFSNIHIGSGCGTTTFSTGMFLWGAEDSEIDKILFDGANSLATGSATVDLNYQTPVGDVSLIKDFFGGLTNLVVWSQSISIFESTIQSIQIAGTTASSGSTVALTDDYVCNPGGGGRIQLNGQTLTVVNISGGCLRLDSAAPLYAGTGTVSNAIFGGSSWLFAASSNWNSGGATLTKQNSDGANHVVTGSAPTNFPFSITSGNF